MSSIVDKRNLFGNEYSAVILCEYKQELRLIKRLIKVSEKAVEISKPNDTWSYDGICHMFAQAIISYSKMAYDTMLLGHFDATHMILRAIIENSVCLEVIHSDEDDILWRNYLVQSYRNTVIRSGKDLSKEDEQILEEMYARHGIEKEFWEKSKKNNFKRPYAFIDKDYGWSYKLNPSCTFSGLCELVDESEYHGFKMMSMYSHGTALYLKIGSSHCHDRIMCMIASIYIGLYRMVDAYCMEQADADFYNITEDIEIILYNYLHKWDE